MVLALPCCLSDVAPCDLALFPLPSWHRGQRSCGVRVPNSRVHVEPSPFLCW